MRAPRQTVGESFKPVNPVSENPGKVNVFVYYWDTRAPGMCPARFDKLLSWSQGWA